MVPGRALRRLSRQPPGMGGAGGTRASPGTEIIDLSDTSSTVSTLVASPSPPPSPLPSHSSSPLPSPIVSPKVSPPTVSQSFWDTLGVPSVLVHDLPLPLPQDPTSSSSSSSGPIPFKPFRRPTHEPYSGLEIKYPPKSPPNIPKSSRFAGQPQGPPPVPHPFYPQEPFPLHNYPNNGTANNFSADWSLTQFGIHTLAGSLPSRATPLARGRVAEIPEF